MVQKPGFKKIWSIFQNQTLLNNIHLTFNPVIDKNDVEQLNSLLETSIHVPVSFREKLEKVDVHQYYWKNWYSAFIQCMQETNQQWLLNKPPSIEKKPDLTPLNQDNQEQIALKKLIWNKQDPQNLLGALTYQQEIREEEQLDIEIAQTTEIKVEQSVEQKIAYYEGKLVDYEQFKHQFNYDALYSFQKNTREQFDFLKYELFGNLPKAIKYLTPQAAEYIHKHLGTLVTFNVNNMPANFKIKETEKGEWVLDIDPNRKPAPKNVFTPQAIEQKYGLFL